MICDKICESVGNKASILTLAKIFVTTYVVWFSRNLGFPPEFAEMHAEIRRNLNSMYISAKF